MKTMRKLFIFLTFVLTPSLIYAGCDGGGNDNGGQDGQTTTINGRIANVVAMEGRENNPFRLAEIVKALSFIKEAKAQGGINVTAMIDGIVVDTDTTDPDGSFTLSFLLNSAENVTLTFDINGTIVSVTITVQEGTILNILVTIDLNA
ncbi:MAG TPA: hypothetical protein VHC46_03950, partial [Thermodesulfobacteriota bacterium]|nr:hypothetical protein [Thermodesulfobacteriota bacterium]